jgi:hypothetical protein
MSQDLSQLFYIDSSIVENSSTVYLKQITVYNSAKPSITNNKSGIYAPGVNMYVVGTKNQVPFMDPLTNYQVSRMAYGEIVSSSDASIATSFVFSPSLQLTTDDWYAFILSFDGGEDFYFWENIKGNDYVGTKTLSAGPAAKYVGPLYGYISSNASLSNTANYLATNWNPVSGASLKFSIDVERFSYDGELIGVGNTGAVGNSVSVVGSDELLISAPSHPTEYITYDLKRSNTSLIYYGDKVYQDQPYYPGNKAVPATCATTNGSPIVLANTSYVLSNGSNFSFKNLFDITTNPEYLVVTSLNHNGPGQHLVNVRKVVQYFNNTQGILLTEPITFTNTNAYFFKAPVGRISSVSRNYIDGSWTDLMILKGSNANTTCRFVNNSINAISISSGGSGYSNTDYLVISGYEDNGAKVSGGYSAVANLATNSSGGITAFYLGNTGAGFVNTAAITYSIKNANNVNSSGTGANLSFTTDSVLKSEMSGGQTVFYGTKVINLDFGQCLPDVNVSAPSGVVYNLSFLTNYYRVTDSATLSGKAYYVLPTASAISVDAQNEKTVNFQDLTNTPILPSRSNQFSIRYANGAVANSTVIGSFYSNAAVYLFDTYSNNDFNILHLTDNQCDSYYDKYNINNDYTNEHTNYGNAVSKHISSKVTLQTDKFAEDMLVYLTAFRPATTDFAVYSRMWNSKDPDAFDDKDWTLLEQIDGIGVYSVLTNQNDMKEYTYNLRAFPNSAWTDTGSVTTSLSSAVVTGSGTNFANLNPLDLVKIYSPLFPNTNYMIAVVSTVANASQLTLTSPVSNVSMTGSGLKIDKIAFPHQVFNDIQNDNVATYYNSSMTKITTFDTFQMKICFLSPNDHIVPKADDLEVDAVSA